MKIIFHYEITSTVLYYLVQNRSSVSPGLNKVQGAHDDEQQRARPGARCEARVTRRRTSQRASRRPK